MDKQQQQQNDYAPSNVVWTAFNATQRNTMIFDLKIRMEDGWKEADCTALRKAGVARGGGATVGNKTWPCLLS